ncbi:hypothetical protein AVEN_219457-1 [Araneus ventricosus]|uniref:Uncharacterized protein n=1 Tax=Araneus ventricosus TaxID=182803 RepID=A0A4Y2BPV2_ARAVE|nr:hypothetical protein AVEN_219457-1 [Araneus ventricosus]
MLHPRVYRWSRGLINIANHSSLFSIEERLIDTLPLFLYCSDRTSTRIHSRYVLPNAATDNQFDSSDASPNEYLNNLEQCWKGMRLPEVKLNWPVNEGRPHGSG